MSRAGKVMVGACVAAALAASFAGREARACGGFFCSQPPPDGTLPIAQAAENVLFVMDKDPATGKPRVEAHVQILYTGPATQFSWIVPVTAVPAVDVGWDVLFERIEPPTRPSFLPQFVVDGVCEGMQVTGERAFSVQHHPEAGPGPHDSRYLFEQFAALLAGGVQV